MKAIYLLFTLAICLFYASGARGQSDSAKIESLFVSGVKFRSGEKLDSAMYCFTKAEKLCIAVKSWEQYVRCENELGILMQYKHDNEKAFEYFRRAFAKGKEIWAPDHSTLGNCYFNISFELRVAGKLDSAYLFLKNAHDIWLKKHGETHDNLFFVYNKLAFLTMDMADFKESEYWLMQALKFKIQKYGEEDIRVSGAYGNLGALYHVTGDYYKSIENSEKSLAILKKNKSDDYKNIAAGYNNIGLVYSDLGDMEKSQEYQETALKMRLEHLSPLHEDLAASYTNLACLHQDKKEFREALDMEKKALSIRRAIFEENNPLIAKSLNNIGLFYYEQDELDKALQWHLQSLAIRLKSLSAENPEVAESYINISNVYKKQKNYDKAIDLQKQSLEIYKKAYGEESDLTSVCYHNLGNIYEDMHQYDQALPFYFQSLHVLSSKFGSFHPGVANSYSSISSVYLLKNNFDSAILYNNYALQSIIPEWQSTTTITDIDFEKMVYKAQYYNILGLRAEILMKQLEGEKNIQRRIEVLDLYRYLARLTEWIRGNFLEQDSKFMFSEALPKIFSLAIDNCYVLFNVTQSQDYLNQAFAFSEFIKAGVLTESINESEAAKFAGIPDSLTRKEKKFIIDITRNETWLNERMESQDKSGTDSIENVIFQTKQNFRIFKEGLKNNYPRYDALKSKPIIPLLSEMSQILSAREAVIQYMLTDSSLFIFTITNKNSQVKKVTLPGSFISDIKNFQISINKVKPNEVNILAPRLYQYLIQPVSQVLKECNNIHIIPDGQLWFVPFEALYPMKSGVSNTDFTKHDYLIKHAAISYHISASLWYKYRNRKNDFSPAPLYDFMGFAPVFDAYYLKGQAASHIFYADTLNMETALRSGSENTWELKPLPCSKNEVDRIQALFRKNQKNSAVYLYQDANKDKFIHEAGNGKIIHIASHAVMNPHEPDLSGIFFAKGDSAAQKDKTSSDHFLYAGEAYNLDLNADLLVLSACETGAGKIKNGDGVMGISRGFIYAGVPNIIYSLWKIGDKNTEYLMVWFYKNFISGSSYSKALQKSKLEMINQPEFAFPKNWAGFVLIGD